MSTDYTPCCPSCCGDDFQPAKLGKVILSDDVVIARIERRGREVFADHYNGEELYHCNRCGNVFESSQAIELKLLEPIEPSL